MLLLCKHYCQTYRVMFVVYVFVLDVCAIEYVYDVSWPLFLPYIIDNEIM